MINAFDFFTARLRFQTDVSDVHTALERGNVVVVDTRGDAGWATGRIPGAVHLPTDRIATDAAAMIPADAAVVTYCWGPGCNGATRAAAEFAALGYNVREMIGGIEYWIREGFVYETDKGRRKGATDPLTAPPGMECAC